MARRSLHGLSAPQDRGERRLAPAAHRPRRRVHPAGAMSFQRRVILVSAAAVALAIAIASLSTYVLVRNDLRRHVNNTLTALADAFVDAEHAMPPRAPATTGQSATNPPYPYA